MPTAQKNMRRLALSIKGARDEDLTVLEAALSGEWGHWSWLALKEIGTGVIVYAQNRTTLIDAFKVIRELKKMLPNHLHDITVAESPTDNFVKKDLTFDRELGQFSPSGKRKRSAQSTILPAINPGISNRGSQQLREMQQAQMNEDDNIKAVCEAVMNKMYFDIEIRDHKDNDMHQFSFDCELCADYD